MENSICKNYIFLNAEKRWEFWVKSQISMEQIFNSMRQNGVNKQELTSASFTSSWYTFTLYSPFFSARPRRMVICTVYKIILIITDPSAPSDNQSNRIISHVVTCRLHREHRPCCHRRRQRAFRWAGRSQTPGCWRTRGTPWTGWNPLPRRAPCSAWRPPAWSAYPRGPGCLGDTITQSFKNGILFSNSQIK